MKFLIWGAGGIGAYYGARLQKAGHDVVLVARGKHLQAMKSHGLKISHEEMQFNDQVCAVSAAELRETCRVAEFTAVLLTLKANATADWLDEAEEWLNEGGTPIISLQNGVDNEPLLAARLAPERVVGGLAVRIGGHVVAPGIIEARGPAQLIIGPWPDARSFPDTLPILNELERVFNQAAVPTTVTADIRYELWRKLLINNGVNPLSALTRLDTRSLTHHPHFGPLVYGMMMEAAHAANLEGVPISQPDVDEMFDLIRSFAAIKTSMLVDLEMGRPLELDAICGAVVRRCQQAGNAAPYSEMALALLRQITSDNG